MDYGTSRAKERREKDRRSRQEGEQGDAKRGRGPKEKRTLRLRDTGRSSIIIVMSIPPLSVLLILAAVVGDLSVGSAERISGLYVDNGFDQTVIHRVVNQREKREVEHEILNLLGMPERPRNTIGRPPQVRRSAPKFLLDVYKNALGEDEEEKPMAHNRHKVGEFDLSGQDLKAIDQSDVIMTFASHSEFRI